MVESSVRPTVVQFIDGTMFGGAEQCLVSLLASIDREGWRLVLFHHPEPGIARLLEAARELGVEMRSVPTMDGGQVVNGLPGFVAALLAERPAVFHAHLNRPLACKQALVAAALARVPVVVATAHLVPPAPPSRWERFQVRVVARCVDTFVAVSYAVAEQLRHVFGVPPGKIRVVHNGIIVPPAGRAVDPSFRTALAGAGGRRVVLTAARLDEQKGLRHLLRAAVEVPEARILLAGDGPERPALEAQARVLGIEERVAFLGYRDDVPDLLASCDLFVLPSLFEGLPLSVLDAMAATKPVVASAIGGTNEAVVPRETGLLVPPGDPTALAAAIRTVLHDPGLAARLGEAGRQRVVQHFSAKTMAQHVTDVYLQFLKEATAPRGAQHRHGPG